ncbi:MAG TPA: hypothetical protein VFV30_12510 [Novosphingobium sp.]|nr:hypothetical protein [Novosphingobium sp.]
MNNAIKLLVSTAMVATSFAPIFAAPAFAVEANATTDSAMETACTALAPTNLLHDGTPAGSAEVGNVVATEAAPVVTETEQPGTRAGVGAPTYSNLSIGAGPFRTGGSVNMFGDQIATTRTFAAGSTFLFDRETSVTTSYTWDCTVTVKTETYTPPQPAQGFYINNGTNPSGGGGSCAGLNPNNPNWGQDIGNCTWNETAPAVEGGWTAGPDVVTVVPQGPTSQTDVTNEYGLTGTDLTPYVQNAGPGDYWYVGKVVICISPKRLPGIWTQQNGYTGDKCTTAWFNVAPWGGGSQDSNGTYISVPAS